MANWPLIVAIAGLAGCQLCLIFMVRALEKRVERLYREGFPWLR